MDTTDGLVMSYPTILSLLVLAELGLPRASVTAAAFTFAMTVPLTMPLTATLYVVPEPVTTAVVGFPVPDSARPAAPNPLTASLNTTVKLIGETLVGSAWPIAWLS